MRLEDLDAAFCHDVEPGGSHRLSQDMAGAQGVQFQCPTCSQGLETGGGERNGEPRRFVKGAHYVICWFVEKVPDGLSPKPGRWTPSGTCIDDLTFVPGDPPRAVSMLMMNPDGCGWHRFVRDGEATLS